MKKLKDQIRRIFIEDYHFDKETANQIISQLDTKKVYETIKDRQGGEFGFRCQTELEWALTALEWMDSDGWFYGNEVEENKKFFLEVFKTGEIIDYIDETWDITIEEKRYVIETKPISKDLLEDTIYQTEGCYCELTESEINENIQEKVDLLIKLHNQFDSIETFEQFEELRKEIDIYQIGDLVNLLESIRFRVK